MHGPEHKMLRIWKYAAKAARGPRVEQGRWEFPARLRMTL